MRKHLACACGKKTFRVRIARDEQVGLVTCPREHHSFLLDSSDYWDDVIQTSKPREKKCACGERDVGVQLEYELRDDKSVRSVTVELTCSACKKRSVATTFEIDYDPTELLVSRPLEPCTDPWLTAKRRELTALWRPADLAALVHHLASEGARCYWAPWKERPRIESAAAIGKALPAARSFDLFFAMGDVRFPEQVRDSWKRLPVIHVPTPMHIVYKTGEGTFYYIEWAEQFLVERELQPQEPALLTLADGMCEWLAARYTSDRGKHTFDNRGEYKRLKGGW